MLLTLYCIALYSIYFNVHILNINYLRLSPSTFLRTINTNLNGKHIIVERFCLTDDLIIEAAIVSVEIDVDQNIPSLPSSPLLL